MEELNKIIAKLEGKNIPDEQIYQLVGVNSILASYRIRKELNEIEYYKSKSEKFPESLSEVERYNISEDPSELELSDFALKKHKKYLKKLLQISIDDLAQNNLEEIINNLNLEVLKIDPQDIHLNGFYTTLTAIEEGILTYEDIGRKVIKGDTKFSELDIY